MSNRGFIQYGIRTVQRRSALYTLPRDYIYLMVFSNLQAGAIEPCGFYVLCCWYLPVSVLAAFRRCQMHAMP